MTASLVRALQEVGACASLLTPAPLSAVCPGDASASLVEFYVECDFYGGASARFTLLAGCFRETDCSGQVVVEYSSKEEPVICSSSPPPPPTRAPTPPPRAPTGPFVCTRQDATCAALGDLYYATNGARWRSNGGWDDAASGVATEYCTFEWASCDGGVLTNLCVRERCAHHRKLRGFVLLSGFSGTTCSQALCPTRSVSWVKGCCFCACLCALGSLSALTCTLLCRTLSENDLTGTVPASLGTLTNLEFIDMQKNRLSGSLPASLGSIAALLQLCVGCSSRPATLAGLSRTLAGRLATTSSADPFRTRWAAWKS